MVETPKGYEQLALSPSEELGTIAAVRIGNNIYIPQAKPLSFFLNYFHEVGHVVGEELSFKNGEVLNPEELVGTYLYLPSEDVRKLRCMINAQPGFEKVDSFAEKVAQDIMTLFTKDNFPLNRVTVHYGMSKAELITLAQISAKGEEVSVADDGQFLRPYSKEARNAEVSAYVAEESCLRILENTLNMNSLEPYIVFVMDTPKKSELHTRAAQVASYAVAKGLVLPSQKDLWTKASNPECG